MIWLAFFVACTTGPDSGGDSGDTGPEPEDRREGTLSFADLDARLPGSEAGAELGAAVAVGDATGDGVPDLLVGARQAFDGGGGAYLVPGPFGPGEQSPDGAAWLGSPKSEQAGTEGCLGADLTGDGVGDVVVGTRAWLGDPAGGVAFVLAGPVTADARLDEGAARLYGDEPDDLFGIAVSCGGDRDGDGAADLLVGARAHDGGAADSGAAFLFRGPLAGDLGPDDAALVLAGAGPDDALGRAVDLRGDLDGDGLADVVAGAYRMASRVGFGGAVYVVGGDAVGVVGAADADVVLTTGEVGASAGRALSAAGDLDGDGRSDLVVGMSGVAALAGAAVVLYAPLTSGDLAGADARVEETRADANLGYAVLAGVDLDADGRSELGLGGPGQHGDGAGEAPGDAWVFYGPVRGTLAVGDAAIHVESGEAGAGVGYALAGGDLDGDGRGDVVIGANLTDAGSVDGGAAAILFGAVP